MNATCIRVLLCLAGCIGLAALAAEPSDSPSRELLEFYHYQPQPAENSSAAHSPPLTSMTIIPLIASESEPQRRSPHNFRDLDEALAQERKRRSQALYTWNISWDTQAEVLAKPDVQELALPWSPVMTMTPFSATEKLEVRVPMFKVLW